MFVSHWFRARKVCMGIFTMEKKIERVCLKCCVFNGITATESLKMLKKCFGESTLSQVFECKYLSDIKHLVRVVRS